MQSVLARRSVKSGGWRGAAKPRTVKTLTGYVKISGTGPNALDFHIAFYIGQFAEKDPGANFYIVSQDAGFDPLLNHLKTLKFGALGAVQQMACSGRGDRNLSMLMPAI